MPTASAVVPPPRVATASAVCAPSSPTSATTLSVSNCDEIASVLGISYNLNSAILYDVNSAGNIFELGSCSVGRDLVPVDASESISQVEVLGLVGVEFSTQLPESVVPRLRRP